MPWQLVPWARMIFSSLAFIRYSIDPWFSRGPARFLHAVQENDVDVVDAQLQAVALEVALGVGEIGRVRLGLDDVLIAGNALSRPREDRRASRTDRRRRRTGRHGRGVADHPGKFLDPQPGLVAGLAAADAAGAHSDQRDLDAGLAQRDHVGRALGQAADLSRPARPGAPWATVVVTATAAVAETAAWAMKSRRLRGGVMTVSPVIRFRSNALLGLKPDDGRIRVDLRTDSRAARARAYGP